MEDSTLPRFAALTIGDLPVQRPLVLAPMAGVTDAAYRHIMARHGVGLVTTEMVSAEGLRRNQPATIRLCRQEPPVPVAVAVQLFGSDPAVMAEGARCAESLGAAIIDINAGCPVRKIVSQGAGASLLRDPDRLARIVGAVKGAVSLPVTVKIRIGWDRDSTNPVALAHRIVSAGADAISVHARTATQQYGGRADWAWIRAVKQAVSVPVIGNGDVTCASLATAMLQKTGCDAVMIGRGTMGNPWLAASIVREWGNIQGTERPVDWEDYRSTVNLHLDLSARERKRPAGHYRKVLMWYSRGCPDAVSLRSKLDGIDTLGDMLRTFDDWVDRIQSRGGFLDSRKLGASACNTLGRGSEIQ